MFAYINVYIVLLVRIHASNAYIYMARMEKLYFKLTYGLLPADRGYF